MKLLYYADSEPGGIFDYSVLQSIALHKLCGNVTVLGLPEYGKRLHAACPELRFVELYDSPRSSNKWVRGLQAIQRRRKQTSQLAELVRRGAFSHVLISNYAEYYAPFWVKPLRRSAKRGVRFGVVIHDPVRDFVVGPKFWHEWCVKLACSFCQDIFVHHAASATDCYWPKESKLTEIAFGPYNIHKPNAIPSRVESRLKLSLDPNAVVFLSFGHIRDGKNLDLVIRALVDVPNCHLLVVGKEQSASQKSVSFYRELADQCGVADRCHWVNRFVADDEVPYFFAASDIALVTYSGAFRSASAALALTSQYRLPVVASSGGGPLQDCIEYFQLGIWTVPDDIEQLKRALRESRQFVGKEQEFQDRWKKYEEVHSWESNAQSILLQFSSPISRVR